ncbi:peptidoglycan editing factor PgeF [Candidatus Pelagibacter sp.]|nr:peptidoglycan editing factor PgeF [Candidatus Pelagibacter sp.]
MIKSKRLLKIKILKHGFFNSEGGFSKNIYKSLNCGPGSKDKPSNVRKNLELVRKKIKNSARDIFLLNQIHSNKFIYVDEKYKFKSKPKVDAVITNQKNLPIAILTADCVPILICDSQKKIIAAIHAGWKGAYKGIVDKVIKFMLKKGSRPQNITAVIGPSISIDNYEVQNDFKNKFLKKDRRNKIFFRIKQKKLYFDLSNYVKSMLLKNRIKKIEKVKIDTFDFRNKFFSARRALSLKHDDYGRNISIIMLN